MRAALVIALALSLFPAVAAASDRTLKEKADEDVYEALKQTPTATHSLTLAPPQCEPGECDTDEAQQATCMRHLTRIFEDALAIMTLPPARQAGVSLLAAMKNSMCAVKVELNYEGAKRLSESKAVRWIGK